MCSLYFLLILMLCNLILLTKGAFICKSQSFGIVNLLIKLTFCVVCVMYLLHLSAKLMSCLLVSMIVINFLESFRVFNLCKLLSFLIVKMLYISFCNFFCSLSLFICFFLNKILVLDADCCQAIDCLLSSHF